MSAARRSAVAEPGHSVDARCPEYPESITSLIGVLQWQQQALPGRVACVRITRNRQGIVTEPLSVDALLSRACAATVTLREYGVRKLDRVILSLSDPHEFVTSFFATLMAGATAVPLPTVAEATAPRSFATRVRMACADCSPTLAIVENRRRFLEVVGDVPGLSVIEPATLDDTAVAKAPVLDQPSAMPAFIQYTSGSTSAPKGVVITHGNILANCRAIRDATGYTRNDRMVAWLPLHHDMGLIGGLLTSIYCAAESCLMSPLTFLARPVTWLEAITHCAGALTVAPTFAYSLCARKIPDKQLAGINLASLRLAYIGAEPIDPSTAVAFIERFASYGLSATALYPVYGLAEATLAVTFPPPGEPLRFDRVQRQRLASDGVAVPAAPDEGDAVTLVSVGQALPRHRIEIVSPETGAPLPERQLGELIAHGASISPGYFGRDATPPELHTGDLAYVADGCVYVVDRIKDLVIVGGQNYAPSDIENIVAEVAGLRRGRIVAFSAPGSGTEQLHIVAEITPEACRSPQALADEAQQRVRHDVGLSPASVTIVAPGSLERTSSGKIKRRVCADSHRNGTLQVMRSEADLAAYVRRQKRARVWYQLTQLWRRLRGQRG